MGSVQGIGMAWGPGAACATAGSRLPRPHKAARPPRAHRAPVAVHRQRLAPRRQQRELGYCGQRWVCWGGVQGRQEGRVAALAQAGSCKRPRWALGGSPRQAAAAAAAAPRGQLPQRVGENKKNTECHTELIFSGNWCGPYTLLERVMMMGICAGESGWG